MDCSRKRRHGCMTTLGNRSDFCVFSPLILLSFLDREPRCLGPRHRQRREGRRQTGTVWSPSSTRGVGSEAEEEEELPACLPCACPPPISSLSLTAPPRTTSMGRRARAAPNHKAMECHIISSPPRSSRSCSGPPHSPEGWADLSRLFPLALLMRPFPCCFFSFPPQPPSSRNLLNFGFLFGFAALAYEILHVHVCLMLST
ncbi:unnamed protein product [Musa banksii]